MSTQMASQHKWIYVGAIVVLVAMAVVGLLTFTQQHATNESFRKADELIGKLRDNGYPTPDREQVARTLGTDGGAVCEDPASALKTGLQRVQMSNGAAGPGQRPVIVPERVVQGEALILQVYCPDQLDDYREQIEDIKTGDTVKN
ncbi:MULTISPECIES: hypothetical protein [Kitasatospora]|uniref:Uncharacterized protein n=1 Tax=Kitasatospora setae (strain ATCC 33774 / DSM 43861 / JCM 3304 / KCC A-0304 / NBRC 14216 / KM-6054) TaxID=452652 RepID=E4NE20_KITSK|nr:MULTISPECIES: hypothetical protein [Kitasatospora]BAJ29451.1 hypothetical protein KSE_36470 [Kitasatospora setae KM-6054]